MNIGGNVNNYSNSIPTDRVDVVGQNSFDDFEASETYSGFEPRLAVNYELDDVSSLKLSYNRMMQYIHLVSNTTAAIPIDVWKPSGRYVDPGMADQVAVGYYRNFKKNMYQLSTEVYYKWMYNILDYRDGADLLLNEYLETELLSGDGRAYGLELMMKKTKGRLTGWVAYTLARTERKVEGFQAGDQFIEGINNGDWYSANWDKPHDITVVGMYEISKKWDFGFNFTYSTGRPITYPQSKFFYDGKNVPYYANRNENRVPDYHRLDLSFTLNPLKNENRKWKSSWIFSVYNLYGRRNPYSIFFRTQEGESAGDVSNVFNTQAFQLSIIGIPVPAVTYNFKF